MRQQFSWKKQNPTDSHATTYMYKCRVSGDKLAEPHIKNAAIWAVDLRFYSGQCNLGCRRQCDMNS